MRNYRHQLNLKYRIPVDKLPGFDWVTSDFSYGATYDWQGAALSVQQRLGNVIQNSQDIQLGSNFDLVKLYNKIGYLRTINEGNRGNQAQSRRRGGNTRPDQQPPDDEAATDSTEKINYLKIIGDGFLRLIMSVRKASFTYNQGRGIVLPGFIPEPTFVGMDMPRQAPGWGFVFGSQKDIRQEAGANGWITRDTTLNNPYMEKFSSSLMYKVSIELFPGFRIDINADRVYAKNHQEYYRYDNDDGRFKSYSATETGAFSITYISWGTAWADDYKEVTSANFEKMKDFRAPISERLAGENPNSQGTIYDSITMMNWPTGYGPTSQDVIIPAFVAAYTNQSPNDVPLDYFYRIPLPNWNLSYDGLSRIGFLQNLLKSSSISHRYTSIYAIGSYKTNLYFDDNESGHAAALYDEVNAYYPEYDVMQVTLTEQFSPLIGIDLTWQNSLQTRFEFKKSRTLTFSMANKQLTDVASEEFVMGLGYRVENVSFTMNSLGGGGRKTNVSSDLNIKVDFSIRNNRTVLRRLDTDQDQISTGQKIISINTLIDYALSRSLSVSLFFDKVVNNPFVSNQYRTSTTRGGIKLRFSLTQ